MGRGDKKSRRGKVAIGSFGVSRRKKALKARSRRIVTKKAEAPAPMPETTPEAPVKTKRTVKKKTEA